jgi:hypothetical protein
MNAEKYIGTDVHKETISIAVMNAREASDGIHHRNQGKYHPAVYARAVA